MKKIIFIFTMFLSTISFAGPMTVKVSVKGMVCGFCAQGITKKFNAEASVSKVDVSLENKLVTIDLKDGQELADNKIEGILKDSGYTVEKIERTEK
jgi:mercuric ion binding protein